MLTGIIISLLLCLSKIFSISYFYNFLFIPFLFYLFLSKDSLFNYSKRISIYSFIFVFSIFFMSFLSLGIKESILFIIFRTLSLSAFVLAIFGLLPYNKKIIEFYILPILLSIPAIFFIFNPPIIYRFSASLDFVSTPGLFNSFSLAGLFPTSAYFAITLLSFLLYYTFNQEIITKYLIFIKSRTLNIFITFILILFTNRKAYFFGLIFSPITYLLNIVLSIGSQKRINSSYLSVLFLSILGLIFFLFIIYYGVGDGGYGLNSIFSQINKRLAFYYEIALSPEKYTFNETAMQNLNFLGGYFSFYVMYILLTFSVLWSSLNLTVSKISIFLVSYFYIFQFLFKEPQTIFSSNPSSLLLFMIISYQIGILQKSKYLK